MKAIWRFFKSLRLTIYLCIAYIVVSFWGSFSLQKNTDVYASIDHQVLLDWFLQSGRYKIDKTFWILLLIAIVFLLAINTIICSIDRISVVWKRIYHINFSLKKEFIQGLKFNRNKVVSKNIKETEENILLRLKSKGYRALSGNTDLSHEDNMVIYADRNRFFAFSEIAVHFAFVLLLFGHLITSLFGVKSTNNLLWEKQKINAPNKNFSILLHDLDVSFYPGGQPKDFIANIGVFREDKEMIRKKIKMNHPLFYQGEVIYLVNFGYSRFGRKYAVLTINRDPGAKLVLWAGILLMLGIWGTFFVSYRRIWVYLAPLENGSIELKIGGWVNQTGYKMERELEKILEV